MAFWNERYNIALWIERYDIIFFYERHNLIFWKNITQSLEMKDTTLSFQMNIIILSFQMKDITLSSKNKWNIENSKLKHWSSYPGCMNPRIAFNMIIRFVKKHTRWCIIFATIRLDIEQLFFAFYRKLGTQKMHYRPWYRFGTGGLLHCARLTTIQFLPWILNCWNRIGPSRKCSKSEVNPCW